MLRFSGDRDFAVTPAELFAKLTDAPFLVQCVPDVETVLSQQPDSASLILRPAFVFVRGTLEVKMKLVEVISPTSAKVLLHSKGIGSSADVEAGLTFVGLDTGTRVQWVAEVKALGGLLKMVPHGLIRGAAEKVINDAWTKVVEKVSGQAPAT